MATSIDPIGEIDTAALVRLAGADADCAGNCPVGQFRLVAGCERDDFGL
jgi:hypothetical protein